MSREANIKLVEDMYVALNTKDLEAHRRHWHEDMIWHGPPGFGDIHGVDGFIEQVMKPFYEAFPDYRAVNEIVVADDAMVSATGTLYGTHRGAFMGVPPTGKPMEMRFSDFWSVVDGRLKENWVMVDHVDTFRQLGFDLLKGLPKA